jgi:hypothetical protein
MVCAEWWGFEVTVIAVGLIGEIELAAHTVAFNTLGICYMIPLGMSVGMQPPSRSSPFAPLGGLTKRVHWRLMRSGEHTSRQFARRWRPREGQEGRLHLCLSHHWYRHAPPHHRTTAPPHHRTTAPPHHRTIAHAQSFRALVQHVLVIA